MTPAPISVDRYTVTGDIAYPIHEDTNGEYVRHSDYAALLHQLAERDAEISMLRNGAEQERLNLLTQLSAAERAREGACELLREAVPKIDALANIYYSEFSDGRAEKEATALHDRIAAFLAANDSRGQMGGRGE